MGLIRKLNYSSKLMKELKGLGRGRKGKVKRMKE